MAAPLALYTNEEQRVVIRFSGLKVCQGFEFIEDFRHNTEKVLYRVEVCMNYEFIEKFKDGRTSVTRHEGAPLLTKRCSKLERLYWQTED